MSEPTKLKVKNGSEEPAKIWITLGAADPKSSIPAVEDVSKLTLTPTVDLTPVPGNPKQASIELAPDEEVEIAAPDGQALNGNFSYDSAPTQCNPALGEPPFDGTTLAEFNLNGGQETLDISCVGGINAVWGCKVDGGTPWKAGPAGVVGTFHNRARANAGLPGVFPYGCDDCTASVSPPSCIEPGKDNEPPQRDAICNVQRDGFDEPGGGTVEYRFVSKLPQKQER